MPQFPQLYHGDNDNCGGFFDSFSLKVAQRFIPALILGGDLGLAWVGPARQSV